MDIPMHKTPIHHTFEDMEMLKIHLKKAAAAAVSLFLLPMVLAAFLVAFTFCVLSDLKQNRKKHHAN